MGYFDELADASFKTDDKGNTIYYPLVIIGKGYILPENRKDTFRLTIKCLLLICMILAVTFSMFLNLQKFFLIILPLYFCVYIFWVKISTSGLETLSDKLTRSKTKKSTLYVYNGAIIWYLEIASFLFVLASVFLLGNILTEWVKK